MLMMLQPAFLQIGDRDRLEAEGHSSACDAQLRVDFLRGVLLGFFAIRADPGTTASALFKESRRYQTSPRRSPWTLPTRNVVLRARRDVFDRRC